MELILVLFYIIFLIILFIWSYYFDNSEEPEILAYNKIMSDEQTQVLQSPEVQGEAASPPTDSKESQEQNTDEVYQKLFDTINKQNERIEKLLKINEENDKKIAALNASVEDVTTTVKENISQVIGGYDYAAQLENMSKEESNNLYKENKDMFNTFKKIFKFD